MDDDFLTKAEVEKARSVLSAAGPTGERALQCLERMLKNAKLLADRCNDPNPQRQYVAIHSMKAICTLIRKVSSRRAPAKAVELMDVIDLARYPTQVLEADCLEHLTQRARAGLERARKSFNCADAARKKSAFADVDTANAAFRITQECVSSAKNKSNAFIQAAHKILEELGIHRSAKTVGRFFIAEANRRADADVVAE